MDMAYLYWNKYCKSEKISIIIIYFFIYKYVGISYEILEVYVNILLKYIPLFGLYIIIGYNIKIIK